MPILPEYLLQPILNIPECTYKIVWTSVLGQGILCWNPPGFFFSPVPLCVILRRIWDVRGISLPNRQEYFTIPLESLFSSVRSLSISGWWWFGSWVRDLPRFADRRDSNRTETLRFYVWRERIWGGVPRRRWEKLCRVLWALSAADWSNAWHSCLCPPLFQCSTWHSLEQYHLTLHPPHRILHFLTAVMPRS